MGKVEVAPFEVALLEEVLLPDNAIPASASVGRSEEKAPIVQAITGERDAVGLIGALDLGLAPLKWAQFR